MLKGSAYEGAQGAVAIEFPPFNVGGSEGVAGVSAISAGRFSCAGAQSLTPEQEAASRMAGNMDNRI